MSYRIHGVAGIVSLFLAAGVGGVAMARAGALWAVVYAALVLAATLAISYAYCAKCPCRRRRCSHVFVGQISRILPSRRPVPYHRGEHIALLSALSVMILLPQFFFSGSRDLQIAFWVLTAFAVEEVLLRVCPHCLNLGCPVNRRKAAE
jgi:hypothetical protein